MTDNSKLEKNEAESLIKKVKCGKQTNKTDFLNDNCDLRDHGDVSIVDRRKTPECFKKYVLCYFVKLIFFTDFISIVNFIRLAFLNNLLKIY